VFKFLKALFSVRKKKVTVILVQENKPAEPDTFSFIPKRMFHVGIYITLLTCAVIFVTLSVTPLGYLLYDREDAEIRQMALDLALRINVLSDSLRVRDAHLQTIQSVLRKEADTTFQTASYESLFEEYSGFLEKEEVQTSEAIQLDLESIRNVDSKQIIYSGKFSNTPEFPAPAPLNGILTQKFDVSTKHYGIDIAASKGSIVRALADGVVISAEWSINYGNTIQIQHGDGYISIIKHCSSLLKKEGDVVLRGDGIGVLGLSGVINTGPHVHIELWRNGVALDPELYLITN
jgi:murein DD-endopeptidase MepM/ murein hydrolase activator NlpD